MMVVVKEIVKRVGINYREIGFVGMKDRYVVIY